MSSNDLQKKIDERKARLAALELERASLLGEIRAFEYAQRQMISPTSARRAMVRVDAAPRRGRLFTRGWGEILLLASAGGNQTFGFKEIQQSAKSHLGHELPALKARSQIADYVTSGYLNRLNPGEFQVTTRGLEALAPFVESPATNAQSDQDSGDAKKIADENC